MSTTTKLKEVDVLVIKILLKHEHMLPIKTISIDEMVELVEKYSDEYQTTIAKPTMYKIVNRLLEAGYLKEGLKANRTRKFYVSPEGAEICSEYCKVSDHDKDKLVQSYLKIHQPDTTTNWDELLKGSAKRAKEKINQK